MQLIKYVLGQTTCRLAVEARDKIKVGVYGTRTIDRSRHKHNFYFLVNIRYHQLIFFIDNRGSHGIQMTELLNFEIKETCEKKKPRCCRLMFQNVEKRGKLNRKTVAMWK